MSSYLERVATSARNPSTRIAPIVRPLYLAPSTTPEPPGNTFEQLDDTAFPRTPRVADEPTNASTPPGLEPGALPVPAAREFEPLLPELRPPEALAPPAPPQSGRLASPPLAARPAETPAMLPAPAHAREPQEPSSSEPSLIPGALSDAALPRIGDMQPSYAPPRASAANRRERRGVDQIQIHIGRVEVVAIAPPQPQPAPPERERRSLRLDDYLRSGG